MRIARPTMAQSLLLASVMAKRPGIRVPAASGAERLAGKLRETFPPVKRTLDFVSRAASGRSAVSAASSESRGQIRARCIHASVDSPGGIRAVLAKSGLPSAPLTLPQVQHILLNPDEQETAEQLAVAIQGGESFEELAKKHSRCPTAANGGDVGWVVKGQLDPAFEEAAFALPVGGEQVGSVKTRFGLHLVRVLSERPAPPGVKEMSVEDLSVKLMEGPSAGVQLIDVREQHEWEICNLPGFKLYPTSLFREWAPTLMGSLDPTVETIVLCHHGVRSRNVAEWLVRQAGFTDVHNVTGGIDLYARAVARGLPRY